MDTRLRVEEPRCLAHDREPLFLRLLRGIGSQLGENHRKTIGREDRRIGEFHIEQPIVAWRRLCPGHVDSELTIRMLDHHRVPVRERSVTSHDELDIPQRLEWRIGTEHRLHIVGIVALLVEPEYDAAALAGFGVALREHRRDGIQFTHRCIDLVLSQLMNHGSNGRHYRCALNGCTGHSHVSTSLRFFSIALIVLTALPMRR